MKRWHLLLVGVAIAGCVSSKAIQYSASGRLPKPKEFPIEIIDMANVKRPYKVIGLVQVDAGARFNLTNPIERLKGEAKKLGGDALIELQQQSIGVGTFSRSGGTYGGHARDLWTAKVIVWEEQGVSVARPNSER